MIEKPNASRMLGDVQPLSGAWMNPYTSAISPMIESTAPTGSSAGFDGSFDVGMTNTLAASATTTIGRFTRKIEPQ